jgi:bifunctional enzyme CysN/CysC
MDDLRQTDVASYLNRQEQKDVLRFITCGSVDDGKSTLIGRLLHDSMLLFDDQLAALERDSKKVGTQGDNLDFALLVDGLAAEREQGITIDVAYRFFTTDRRKFIVADTPGHEQYTRNMVSGASTADLAVLLVDARKGVLTQTRRHSTIVSLLGVKTVVLAVNKMDAVDYQQSVFDAIVANFRAFASRIGVATVVCIPVSALRGDNVARSSDAMPWYRGMALLPYLETVDVGSDAAKRPMRLPVQIVQRPNQDFRGFSGTIASGRLAVGDAIAVVPSGRQSRIARIAPLEGEHPDATAGQARLARSPRRRTSLPPISCGWRTRRLCRDGNTSSGSARG